MDQDFSFEGEQPLNLENEDSGDFSAPIGGFDDEDLPTESLLARFGLGSAEEVETLDTFAFPILEPEKDEAEPEPLSSQADADAPELESEESQEAPVEMLPPAPGSGELLPDPFAEREEEQPVVDERAWYIIHCYSGYEQKVKYNLEQRIESMGMQDFIFQVVVPTVEEIEIKDGKRRTVERCLYPGYIMVQMALSDDSWYVVRNTPGVTGFVGMGNAPVPLRTEQVQNILRRMEAAAPQVRATFKPGQKVRIIEGPFADFIGVVDEIDEERTKVRVLVSFFGRETPVELDFLQVEKV